MTTTPNNKKDRVHGRVFWILMFLALLQTLYPISYSPNPIFQMLYNWLYFGLVFAGLWLTDERKKRILLWLFGIPILVLGAVFVFYQKTWVYTLAYLAYEGFFVTVAWVLFEYIFKAKRVTLDVIYAAVTVYVLIGAMFVPLYGIVETLAPGSFIDNGMKVSGPFPWQNFAYFSYVTLTTLGYGDILPVQMWARALVGVEAVSGTMYLTIIMARLVGLYAAHEEATELGGGERQDASG
ncbi:MAG TPA: ion channel [Anaerolineales bacterium]|nr:ion channel [Anaerolineales bacterium]